MRRGGAVVVVAAVILLAACGSSTPRSAKKTPVRAGRESVRISMTAVIDHGEGEIRRTTMDGIVDSAGNSLMTQTLETGDGRTLESSTLRVDGHSYLRSGSSGPWTRVDVPGGLQSELPDFTDPFAMFDALSADGDVKRVGTETIDGVATTHYEVTLDEQKLLRNATPELRRLNADTGDPGTVDVWVDAGGRTRQVTQHHANDAGVFTTTFRFHDFGAEVQVPHPAPDEITSGSSTPKTPSTTTAG